MSINLPVKKYRFLINKVEHEVEINKLMDNKATVSVNGRTVDVEFIQEQRNDLTPKLVLSQTVQTVQTPVSRQPVTSRPNDITDASTIAAPMPGAILKIMVKAGDDITPGQTVIIMEAMKMENEVRSTMAGKVKEIEVKEGGSVLEGDILIRLEPAAKSGDA